MGCDIHIIMLRKHKGNWVTVDPPPPIDPEPTYGDPSDETNFGRYLETSEIEELAQSVLPFEDRIPSEINEWNFWRDYEAFGHVAGVRGGKELSPRKGWPPDWDAEAYNEWCHSPTWFAADEWAELCRKHRQFGDDKRWTALRDAMRNIAGRYGVNLADVRMVICFDN